MKFSYPAEKFNQARSCLMLPHSRGEAASIGNAFHECHLGLHNLDTDSIDDTADGWIRKLEDFMDTSGISDSSDSGHWQLKAEQFSTDQKIELSHVIDELAHWFDDQNRS